MVKVLEHLGVMVHYNPNQTCCGQMAFNSGHWDNAKSIGIKFLHDFNNQRPVVCPSASCAGYVKNYFEKLFYNTGYHLEYREIRKNIFEITDYLVNVLKVTNIGAEFNAIATYHDSCAALREYGLTHEPRTLLKHVKGLELREMEESDTCCGFGGTFSVKFEAISSAMAHQKVHHALDTGAEYIISTDSSCLMHQESYIKQNNLPLKIIHVVDVLASGLK